MNRAKTRFFFYLTFSAGVSRAFKTRSLRSELTLLRFSVFFQIALTSTKQGFTIGADASIADLLSFLMFLSPFDEHILSNNS